MTNTKHTSCFFCVFLLFHFVFLWYLLSYCFCLERGVTKDHDIGLTDSEDEKGFGGGENMIKTHCVKKISLKKWLGKVLNTLLNSFFEASFPLLT